MKRFEGRVVMITGAGSGIGQATALRLASEGASVFCVDLNLPAVEATAASVVAEGGKAVAHGCNVADEAEVNDCVTACITEYGSLYCLVHMAGLLRFEHTHEMEKDSWQQIIDVNLTGTFLLCKAALPHLVASQGNIVNAASTAALAGLPWGAAYSASKGGVLAMTRSIAVEYAQQGVRANCVCPGDIKTNMTADVSMPGNLSQEQYVRMSSITGAKGPEVVAGVIAMLASDDGSHITGEDIRMDGGTLS
jgi:meso-butanediol dehydrogenase/(S,S)-butanediol dehydrogenase/diacetyl reductase